MRFAHYGDTSVPFYDANGNILGYNTVPDSTSINDNTNLMPDVTDYAPGTTVSGTTVTLPPGTVAASTSGGSSSGNTSTVGQDIASILGIVKNTTNPTVQAPVPTASSSLLPIILLGGGAVALYFYFKSKKKAA